MENALLQSISNAVIFVLFAAAVGVVVIGGVRLVRAIITASHALEQIGRAMEDIARTLKKDRM